MCSERTLNYGGSFKSTLIIGLFSCLLLKFDALLTPYLYTLLFDVSKASLKFYSSAMHIRGILAAAGSSVYPFFRFTVLISPIFTTR